MLMPDNKMQIIILLKLFNKWPTIPPTGGKRKQKVHNILTALIH